MSMESRLVVARERGEGVGQTGSLGLVDANCYIWNGWAMESYCIAQGTVYDWVTLLYNRNWSIVNQLHFNKKFKKWRILKTYSLSVTFTGPSALHSISLFKCWCLPWGFCSTLISTLPRCHYPFHDFTSCFCNSYFLFLLPFHPFCIGNSHSFFKSKFKSRLL